MLNLDSGKDVPHASTPDDVLDNPAWGTLTGAHAHLAERNGSAARFPDGVAPFAALADPADPDGWRDLLGLVGPGRRTTIAGATVIPADWELLETIDGVQLVAAALRVERDPAAIRLGLPDVPEMLDLVARTKPGPFIVRTIEMGHYYGIRHDGALVAMAGERMRPPGWTEVSGVCTDPNHRGQGLAARLIRTVAAGIRERGDTPFLHAAADNTNAIRLYDSMGFTFRRPMRFLRLRTPVGSGSAG